MRRLNGFIFCLLLSMIASAQTQQGFVKTKGRMVNGKHVAGKGLQGAVVALHGRSSVCVQNANGSFSFPVVGKNYTVQSVTKNGYQLVDADAAPKAYAYSSNPLYLVMETPEQQMEDLLEAEEKISKTLREQLKKARAELQQLKDNNIIMEEDYRRRIAQLMQNQLNNQKLISDMANEYAQMDYDQMDELKRQIKDAILNGRLAQADSLTRSKGDIKDRIEKVKHKQFVLNEAKIGTKKEIEDIEEDCKNLSNLFMLELKVDSAAYYVELLVSLDSTDIRFLGRVGNFYQDICSYKKAESYYKKALNICQQSVADNAFEICALKLNLAEIYKVYRNYSEAEKLIKDNIELVNLFGGKINSITNEEECFDECVCLISLAGFYTSTKQYTEAETILLKVLRLLQEGYFDYEDEKKQSMTAGVLFMLGQNSCGDDRLEDNSDNYFMEAVRIERELALKDSSCFANLGGLLSMWAFIKLNRNHYEESESLYFEALDAFNKSYKVNKELDIAQIWWQLANLYQYTNSPSESEKLYKEAICVYRRYALNLPDKYNDQLSNLIKDLARLYKNMWHFEESASLLKEAYRIDSLLAQNNPQEYTPKIAYIENELGKIYGIQKKYHVADSLFNDALMIRKQFAEEDHEAYDSLVVETLSNLAILYSEMAQFYDNDFNKESEKWLLKALEVQQQLVTTKPKDYELGLAEIMERIADIYWNTQRYHEAEAMYDGCLQIVRKFSKLNANIQRNYVNLLHKLSQMYPTINNYNATYKINKEWITILKQQFEEYPDLIQKDYAECLGRQSFYAIFKKQYAEAEHCAREGLEVDSTQHWIASNLAASFLFQCKYEEAETIYRKYKDELKDSFLDDFRQFAEAGVIPKEREEDVERIKRILNE